jgi:hypothetical protein
MNTKNNLLILERSSSELEFKQKDGIYVLEGVFGEIDKKNRNNRIYTESEYVPQIEALQAKIGSSKLLGELDHPQTFDVSLKNVSHIIEELSYDKETKQVKGKIRLLDTEAGRQAKALVDAGVPLQISSRAAGQVESNGTVKIKQLFTYDLVADPGFENAELKRVNESFGFENDSDIQIYEISDTKELLTTENKTETKMAESKFVSTEDFNKYSQYLSSEIKSLKEEVTSLTGDESVKSEVESVKEYSNYLAEKLEKTIEYSAYLAENLDNTITTNNEISEKLDNSISYSEHIAEGVESIKDYTNYLAESYNEGATTHENLLKYIDYLKENLEKVTEYAEYVAETVNSNLLLEDEAGKEVEEIEDEDDSTDVTEPTVDAEGNELDHGGEVEDKSDELEDELEDTVDDAGDEEISEEEDVEAVEETEEEDVEEGNAFGAARAKAIADGEEEFTVDGETFKVKDVDAEDKENAEEFVEEEVEATEESEESEDVEATEESEESEESEDVEEAVDALDSYKSEITSKLSALIEKATAKENSNPHFFRFISEAKKSEYNELSTEDQSTVLKAVEGKGFLTEGQIITLWNSSLIKADNTSEPNVIAMMPEEYKETWSKLSEAKKTALLAQSKYHKLETSYQVRNFWQTRDLRDVAVVMEKVETVNEAAVEAPAKKPLYDLTNVKEEIAKKFKK